MLISNEVIEHRARAIITSMGYNWAEIGGSGQNFAKTNAWIELLKEQAEAQRLYVYTVTGIGMFPSVMLYANECWPANADGADLITYRGRAATRIPRLIVMVGRMPPDKDMWEREGRKPRNAEWHVESIDTLYRDDIPYFLSTYCSGAKL